MYRAKLKVDLKNYLDLPNYQEHYQLMPHNTIDIPSNVHKKILKTYL
jgi:hypothetical protein